MVGAVIFAGAVLVLTILPAPKAGDGGVLSPTKSQERSQGQSDNAFDWLLWGLMYQTLFDNGSYTPSYQSPGDNSYSTPTEIDSGEAGGGGDSGGGDAGGGADGGD